MSKKQTDLDKREVRLPDGRRLIYYSFPDAPRRPGPSLPPDPESPATPGGPRGPEGG